MENRLSREPPEASGTPYGSHQKGPHVEESPYTAVLPLETLSSICKAVLDGSSSTHAREYYLKLETLRLVCRLWNSMLCASPVLWLILSSHQPSRSWKHVLSRSYPLGFHAILHPGCDQNTRIFFTDHLVTRMDRLESASLTFSEPIEEQEISAFIRSRAPSLTSLFMVFSNANLWELKLNGLFVDHAPVLTHVSITANIADELRNVAALSNGRLESLSIENYQSRPWGLSQMDQATVDFIPDILLCSPNLARLSLKWCKMTKRTRDAIIILEEMRDLMLWVTEDFLLEFICKNVNVVNCRSTTIITWDGISRTLEPLVTRNMLANICSVIPERQLRLSFLENGSFEFNGAVTYALHGDWISEDLQALGRILSLFPVEIRDRVDTLTIATSRSNEVYEIFHHFVMNVLPAFSGVVELHLDNLFRGFDLSLLEGDSSKGPQANDYFPCPRLQRIRLSSQLEVEVSQETLESIHDVVIARAAFALENSVEGYAALKSLYLPLSTNSGAISQMFGSEGVTVVFEGKEDIHPG